MTNPISPGLGALLRHLLELTDGSAQALYQTLDFPYRPRYTPIMRVLQHGSATVAELRDQLNITQGAVSQTLQLMQKAGLIAKGQSGDGRQTIVSLSDHGQAVLKALQPHWAATLKAIEVLEEEIQQPLMCCLQQACEALETRTFAERIQAIQALPDGEASSLHFQHGGQDYARFRPTYPHALAEALAECCPERQLAVDVGCGSGQLTALLSPHFDQVLGTDPSESQLQSAKAADNIRYQPQSAESIGLPDGCADLVVAAQAAHWFDLERFYAEVRRVAKPHGCLALVSYGVPYIDDALNALFQQGYWQTLHRFWPAERRHVERAYADLYFPFAEWAFPSCSIRQSMTVETLVGYIKTWSAYAQAEQRGERSVFEGFFRELYRAWPQGTAKTVVWPIAVRAGRVARA